jgi:hypothetical protein
MDEEILALFIPIIAIFMSLLIPIVFAIVDYRRRRDLVEANHKERMAAIERGMELPPMPEALFQSMKPARRSSYLLPGLIWLFVGLAFLIYYFVEGRKLPPVSGGSLPRA